MRRIAAAICLPILLGMTSFAQANGALAEFPAGGVVFKPTKDISIAREDLEIGWDRIRVRYLFRSTGSAPIEATIGFPMAKVPQDDSPDGFQNDSRNYMDFSVTVNGEPLEAQLHEFAWLGETNITSNLREMGVPVFAATPDLFVQLANLPEATVAALKAENLALEEGPWLIPQWLYQSVYEWKQRFEPGITEVEVSYAPRFGASNEYSPYYPGGEFAADYCIDEAFEQKLAGHGSPYGAGAPFTVGYILTTARNWNGPIGEFNLKIANRDSLATFCVPDGLAPGDGADSWHARDFVPQSDLKVLFFYHGSGL